MLTSLAVTTLCSVVDNSVPLPLMVVWGLVLLHTLTPLLTLSLADYQLPQIETTSRQQQRDLVSPISSKL